MHALGCKCAPDHRYVNVAGPCGRGCHHERSGVRVWKKWWQPFPGDCYNGWDLPAGRGRRLSSCRPLTAGSILQCCRYTGGKNTHVHVPVVAKSS